MTTRRTALGLVAGAAAAFLLAPVTTGAAGADSTERRALAALSRAFADPGPARAVGAACLDCTGRPAIRDLAADLGTTVTDLATLDRRALRRRLGRRIRADFGAGRVVAVDRWVLSRTETRLYALIAAAG